MRLLLDTHVFLWWLDDDRRLAGDARAKIEAPANKVFVSAVSIWEIALKASVGKLRLTGENTSDLAGLIPLHGFAELAVSARHAAAVRDLPFHHADPFDRLLIVQAALEETSALLVAKHGLDPLAQSEYRATILQREYYPK